MSEPILIGDWTCWIMPSGIRAASPNGKSLVNLMSFSDAGLATSGTTGTLQAPPAVLAWLVAPLLARAWSQGHAASSDNRFVSDSPYDNHLNPLPVPARDGR